MPVIQTPLRIPELHVRPEQSGGMELSDNMQQVLATLTGFWRNQRMLLRASPGGILMTADPQLRDIFTVTGSGANDTYQGENIQCSSVLVMGHPDNTGRVWVRPHAVASVDNGWPLDAGDMVSFGLTNLSMFHALIVTDANKLIVAYTD